MKVINKINNNVAVCQDKNGKELIALGKGIGFPKMPYELEDLSKIDMTFYKVSPQNLSLLQVIPEKVITVSGQIVKLAQQDLKTTFSPNAIVSLADHINFAIERMKKKQFFAFSLAYDIEHLYPDEFSVGKKAIELIKNNLNIDLPEEEATAIALHFINLRENPVQNINRNTDIDLLNLVVGKIENYFYIHIDKKSFIFNRFRVHFQYYLDRLNNNRQISAEISPKLIRDTQEGNRQVSECTKDIVSSIDEHLNTHTTDDEMFYLMIYINRMIKKLEG